MTYRKNLSAADGLALRRRLIALHGPFCALCGHLLSPTISTIDHIRPQSAGGSGEESNLRAVHAACNSRRQDREPDRLWCARCGCELFKFGCPLCE